jgi:antitoxin component of RelBE/YafQ-DinJ toxin-antitoxin module
MAIKTFNVDEMVYHKFSGICKEYGISMSKQVEMFMRSQIEEEPKVREEYLRKLETIRNGRFTKVNNIADRYGLK